MLCRYLRSYIFQKVSTLIKILYWEIECTRQVTDEEDNINLGKFVSDDKNQQRNSWACLGQTCPRSLIVFLFELFVKTLNIFGWFWRIYFSKIFEESIVCVGILRSRIGFNITKTMNKLIFTKNWVLLSLVGPSKTGTSQPIYNCLKFGTFQLKFDKIHSFYQHSQSLYDVMQNEIENLEFV